MAQPHERGDHPLMEREYWPLPCDPDIEEDEVDGEEDKWWAERGLKPPPRSEDRHDPADDGD